MSTPVGVVINGLTGFAWVHHRAVFAAEQKGLCRLLGYCDHQPSESGERTKREYRLEERGVPVFPDFASMLDSVGERCRLAFIPSPPTIHAADHAAAISRGIRCYLEKPPTLSPSEFEAMLDLERRVGKSAIVGFNEMADPVRFELKRRLVRGEFGALERIDVLGFWPRPAAYYGRSRWPGKLMLDGQLVLDSVFGNAMAHYLHGMLFWGRNDAVWSWASAASVEAELYRAYEIESADTAFARGMLNTGVSFRVAFSHACAETIDPVETLHCRDATVRLRRGSATVAWSTGRVEDIVADPVDSHDRCIARVIAEVNGEAVEIPSVGLQQSASFVKMNALLYVAGATIHQVEGAVANSGPTTKSIQGVEQAGQRFITDGRLPSEQRMPWGRAGGWATAANIDQLERVIAANCAARLTTNESKT